MPTSESTLLQRRPPAPAPLPPEADGSALPTGVVRTHLLSAPYDAPRPERINALTALGYLPHAAAHVERVERREMMLRDYETARPLTGEEFAELALCQKVLRAFENAEHPRKALPLWTDAPRPRIDFDALPRAYSGDGLTSREGQR